jgi:hypothetical protein
MRCCRLLILPAVLWGLFGAPTATECQDKLAACVKAHNCAKSPNSAECKACKAAFDGCTASEKDLRVKKSAPAKKAA